MLVAAQCLPLANAHTHSQTVLAAAFPLGPKLTLRDRTTAHLHAATAGSTDQGFCAKAKAVPFLRLGAKAEHAVGESACFAQSGTACITHTVDGVAKAARHAQSKARHAFA